MERILELLETHERMIRQGYEHIHAYINKYIQRRAQYGADPRAA